MFISLGVSLSVLLEIFLDDLEGLWITNTDGDILEGAWIGGGDPFNDVHDHGLGTDIKRIRQN
mgnify:CR=1 FL=1